MNEEVLKTTGIFGFFSSNIDSEHILKIVTNTGYSIRDLKLANSCFLCGLDIVSYKGEKIVKKVEDEISIVLCGEVYNEDILDLGESIKELYETNRLDLLKNFNGSFAAAIYDTKRKKLTVVNDRYGSVKLFYSYDEKYICFAPKIKPLLDLGAKKNLRNDAIFDFLIFGFLVGEKTFFKDVFQLPPAAILEFSNGNVKLSQYWEYKFDSKNYDTRSREQLIDELAKLWDKSIERRIKKGEQIIIPLSGGFDSRAILAAALNYSSKDNMITCTYGEKDSFDFTIGNMVAQKTGIRNIPLGVEKVDFEDQYRISLHDSEGMIDATPYFAINGYQKINTVDDRIISGFMGGEIMGSLILRKMMNFRLESQQDYERARTLIFDWRTRNDYNLVKKLCTPLLKDIPDFEYSFSQTTRDLNKISTKEFVNYCATWLLRYEEWNYTSFCVLRFRNRFKFSIPFLDNDLIDFMMKIPPHLRFHKYLYKLMLLKKYPTMFTLPTKNTYGRRLDANKVTILLYRIFLFGKRKSNSISNKIMKKNLFFNKTTNYIDYNNLLRTNKEYQEFMKKYINKVKLRQYFNTDFIEELWQSHINGKKNYATLFGLLVTFELFLENYVDDENQTREIKAMPSPVPYNIPNRNYL